MSGYIAQGVSSFLIGCLVLAYFGEGRPSRSEVGATLFTIIALVLAPFLMDLLATQLWLFAIDLFGNH